MLSEKAKELIKKSRIVSFSSWHHHPSKVVAIFQQADDEDRYLTDEEMARIAEIAPSLQHSLKQARLLQDNATEIIDRARAEIEAAYPHISEPGGGLYPPIRAKACWRDFWHFLRCISYGIAGQSTDYTSDRGLVYMEELYREMQVPLDAMVLGLKNLKVYALQQFEPNEARDLVPYFDHLIKRMAQFTNS